MIGGHTRGLAQYQGRALQKPARPGQPSPGWRARVVRGMRVAGLTLVITGLSVAAPVIGEVVVNSPLLAVREVRVTGTRLLTPQQVARMAGVREGMPVIGVSPSAIETVLKRSPRIANAVVERGWSGNVKIAITERQGVAMLSTVFEDSAAAPLIVANDGVLLEPLGPQEGADLPFLTGLTAPHMNPGDRIPLTRFRPIASLLALLRRPDVALTPEISSVDLAPGDTIWLTTLRNGSRVLLPHRPLTVDDMVSLGAVLADCEKQNMPAQRIDMTFKDMIVLDPADPLALQRQAREHKLEEQHLADAVRARQATADSLARVAALAPATGDVSLAPRVSSRRPILTADSQRGPRRAHHSSTSRRRSATGDGRHLSTSHRSLPRW